VSAEIDLLAIAPDLVSFIEADADSIPDLTENTDRAPITRPASLFARQGNDRLIGPLGVTEKVHTLWRNKTTCIKNFEGCLSRLNHMAIVVAPCPKD
jgi:hypothetical protein